MHNASVYNTVLCKLLEFGCLPLVEALGQRQVHETQRRDMLRAQIADLKKQIEQKRRQEKSKAEKGQGKRKTQTVGREEQLEEQGSDEKGGGRKNKKAKIEHR